MKLLVFSVVVTCALAVPIHFENGQTNLSEETPQLLAREAKSAPEQVSEVELNPPEDFTISFGEHKTGVRTFHKLKKKKITHQPPLIHHSHHQPHMIPRYKIHHYRENEENIAKEAEVKKDQNKNIDVNEFRITKEDGVNLVQNSFSDFENFHSVDTPISDTNNTPIQVDNLYNNEMNNNQMAAAHENLKVKTAELQNLKFNESNSSEDIKLKNIKTNHFYDIHAKNAEHVTLSSMVQELNSKILKEYKKERDSKIERNQKKQSIHKHSLVKAAIRNDDAEIELEHEDSQKIDNDSATNFMKSTHKIANQSKLLVVSDIPKNNIEIEAKMEGEATPNLLVKSKDGPNLGSKLEEHNVEQKENPHSTIISTNTEIEPNNSLKKVIQPFTTKDAKIMIMLPNGVIVVLSPNKKIMHTKTKVPNITPHTLEPKMVILPNEKRMQDEHKKNIIKPITLEPQKATVIEPQSSKSANGPIAEQVSSLLKPSREESQNVRKVLPLDVINISDMRSEHSWKFHPHAQGSGTYGLGGTGASYGNVNLKSSSAVAVFLNSIKNCAIPLLISCSPSVVSGSLSMQPNSGYNAPAYRASYNFMKQRNDMKTKKLKYSQL